jgi:hypothetical protein
MFTRSRSVLDKPSVQPSARHSARPVWSSPEPSATPLRSRAAQRQEQAFRQAKYGYPKHPASYEARLRTVVANYYLERHSVW